MEDRGYGMESNQEIADHSECLVQRLHFVKHVYGATVVGGRRCIKAYNMYGFTLQLIPDKSGVVFFLPAASKRPPVLVLHFGLVHSASFCFA